MTQQFVSTAINMQQAMSQVYATASLSSLDSATGDPSVLHRRSASPSQALVQNFLECIRGEFDVALALVLLHNNEIFMAERALHLLHENHSEANKIFGFLQRQTDLSIIFENTDDCSLFLMKVFSQAGCELAFTIMQPFATTKKKNAGVLWLADVRVRNFSLQNSQRLEQCAQLLASQLDLAEMFEKEPQRIWQKDPSLADAFELANIGTWEYDVNTKRFACSSEMSSLYRLGSERTETNLPALCASLLQQHEFSATNQLPQGSDETVVDHIVKADGTIVYLQNHCRIICDENGKAAKIIGVSQDVTEHLVYEEKLRESEERFRALVQNSSDMTAVLDEKGFIKYISPTSLAISGYAPEELIGRNVFSFMHEDDMVELVTQLQNVANSVNSGEPTLHRFRTKSGAWIWLESKGMNMMGNAHVDGIIINAREVTERIHLEERLALEEQNRQRAITSAVIKAQENERSQIGRELHDNINQVLTTVKLYTELICDGIGEQKELGRKAGQHLQDCIDEIRNISKRLSAPTLGEISLDDSIKELIESINLTNRIEITYSGHATEGLQIPQELHLAIYRIIQEQLNNILRYAGAQQVSIVLRRKGSSLTLQITDNGKGFDLAAKRTGIGITNMRTRAENQNGVFHLESAPQKGCRLKVIFPLPGMKRSLDSKGF